MYKTAKLIRKTQKAKKEKEWKRLCELIENYNKIMIVSCNYVSSHQFQKIRQAIRPLGAEIFMGKNSLMNKVFEEKSQVEKSTDKTQNDPKHRELKCLVGLIKGTIGLIFCKDNMPEVKKTINKFPRSCFAKEGQIAKEDIYIPKGATGLNPGQTSGFSMLNIPTKILKGQIEIVRDARIAEKGKKLGRYECEMLQRLNIKPFVYYMNIIHVYDGGVLYADPLVLDLTQNDILPKFRNGCSLLAALCIQSGYPTPLSVNYSMSKGIQYIRNISYQLQYENSIFKKSKLNTTETALKKPIKGDIDVEDINIKFLFDEVDDDEANTEGLNLDVDNLF